METKVPTTAELRAIAQKRKGSRKGRMTKFTPEQVRNIKIRYASEVVSQGELCKEYGTNLRTLRDVLFGAGAYKDTP